MILIPLLSIMDLSKCKDRIVHFRYLGVMITVKDWSNHNITPILYNGFAQVK